MPGRLACERGTHFGHENLVRRGLRPELLPLEAALFAVIFWGDEAGYVPLSKTPFLFLVAWGSLRLRGLRWRDVGLQIPARWPRIAAFGIAGAWRCGCSSSS